MTEFITDSPQATEKIASDLARELKTGGVIALSGNLGAGKTVFVKGLAKALGVKENITSPTFVLLKVYNIDHKIIKRFIHVDCYRLEGKEDLHDLGLSDYLADASNLIVIEWADKISDLPADTKQVIIDYVDDKQRRLAIK